MRFFTRKWTHIVGVINNIPFLPTVVLLALCQLAAALRSWGTALQQRGTKGLTRLPGPLTMKGAVRLCVRTEEGAEWPSLAKIEGLCHKRGDRLGLMETLEEKTSQQFAYFQCLGLSCHLQVK